MDKASTPSKRIAYLDIAKGIGILLVVLAHSDLALISPYLHRFIYSFHVPLFFFLSGYFFNAQIPFGTFVRKRFNAVLKPYLFTIFLIYLVTISFTNMSFGTMLGRFAKSMYATGEYIEWIPLWFLPSLFLTSLFSYFFYRLVLFHISNRNIRWLILLGLQAVGVIFVDAFYPFTIAFLGKEYELYGLPYSLDLVLLSGFFYMLGSEIRQISLDNALSKKWFLLLTGAGLILLNAAFSQRVDISARVFESFPINTAEAILGILFTLALSKQIELTATRLASTLGYIGKTSLFILIFHAPIQEYWGAKIYFMTELRWLSILLAFAVSVLVSLGFNKFFVERNPIALFWFGRKAALPKKREEGND